MSSHFLHTFLLSFQSVYDYFSSSHTATLVDQNLQIAWHMLKRNGGREKGWPK